jgi:hypothetical protein
VVLEAARQHPVRRARGALLGEEKEAVLAHRDVQRRAFRFPVGEKLVQRARIHDRAGEDVRADLRALLDQADGFRVGGELLEPDRGGETGGAAADDDHVVLHRFAAHARHYIIGP